MLSAMFSGQYKLEPDENGAYFIDRDGTHFRYILNFLRTNELILPDDPLMRKELLIEAEYYSIPGMISQLQPNLETIRTVEVYRSKLELPRKFVECDESTTLDQLLQQVISVISKETTLKYFYRFRRVAFRKNGTKRPMEPYSERKMTQKLSEIFPKKRDTAKVYLEQSVYPTFFDAKDFEKGLSVSIRVWNIEKNCPSSLEDFLFNNCATFRQLKEFCGKYLDLKPEEMVIVDEETEELVHRMDDDFSHMRSKMITSGDILHVEPLTPKHKECPLWSLTREFYESNN